MNTPESNKEAPNKNQYTTADIFEITAIAIKTGGAVVPSRLVVTFGTRHGLFIPIKPRFRRNPKLRI